MPPPLKGTFTAVPKYDPAPFRVTLEKATFTVVPAAELRGRVIDHTGKPVAGAEVFLGGPQLFAEIVDGEFSDSVEEREKTKTDAEGRFALNAVAKEEAGRIIVLAPSLHVWAVPVPDPPGPIDIGGGLRFSDFIGTAKVTVTEDGPPPLVRIEMKPR